MKIIMKKINFISVDILQKLDIVPRIPRRWKVGKRWPRVLLIYYEIATIFMTLVLLLQFMDTLAISSNVSIQIKVVIYMKIVISWI